MFANVFQPAIRVIAVGLAGLLLSCAVTHLVSGDDDLTRTAIQFVDSFNRHEFARVYDMSWGSIVHPGDRKVYEGHPSPFSGVFRLVSVERCPLTPRLGRANAICLDHREPCSVFYWVFFKDHWYWVNLDPYQRIDWGECVSRLLWDMNPPDVMLQDRDSIEVALIDICSAFRWDHPATPVAVLEMPLLGLRRQVHQLLVKRYGVDFGCGDEEFKADTPHPRWYRLWSAFERYDLLPPLWNCSVPAGVEGKLSVADALEEFYDAVYEKDEVKLSKILIPLHSEPLAGSILNCIRGGSARGSIKKRVDVGMFSVIDVIHPREKEPSKCICGYPLGYEKSHGCYQLLAVKGPQGWWVTVFRYALTRTTSDPPPALWYCQRMSLHGRFDPLEAKNTKIYERHIVDAFREVVVNREEFDGIFESDMAKCALRLLACNYQAVRQEAAKYLVEHRGIELPIGDEVIDIYAPVPPWLQKWRESLGEDLDELPLP